MEDATASEELNEWEQIQSTTPTETRRWVDVVVMRDNYLNDSSTFPPSNHEGLPITPQDNQSLHSSPSSASDEGDDGNAVSVAGEIGRRLRLHLRLLSSGVYRIAFTVRNYAVCRGGFWSFVSVTGVLAALLMSLVYVNLQRWRRRVQQENKDLPILLIREKDEKIKQLLLQIAQMNELLSARRRVPVLRVG
uniref:Transmembrane protein n=1 Tax=Davidia involucrata TaxID=16924 RepID=A0A5B7BNB7_DAVIN